jgi:hypothetical protein
MAVHAAEWLPPEVDFTSGNSAHLLRQKAHYRQGSHALAAARLSDNAHDFSFTHRDVNSVDYTSRLAVKTQAYFKTSDFQQVTHGGTFFRESLIINCWLLLVVCCWLPVGWRLVAGGWWLLAVACCLLPVACCLLPVACCLLSGGWWLAAGGSRLTSKVFLGIKNPPTPGTLDPGAGD